MAMKRYSKVVWPGFSNAPAPRHIRKIGRNDPCPCGSGKKYKECHERDGTAFLEKLAREEDKRLLREKRRRLKEEGVPWYRRLFVR
jgi:hypothetical protein